MRRCRSSAAIHSFRARSWRRAISSDEQRYFIGKDRRHVQLLHGWGTVCGLKVHPHPTPACETEYIVISARRRLSTGVAAARSCCARRSSSTSAPPCSPPGSRRMARMRCPTPPTRIALRSCCAMPNARRKMCRRSSRGAAPGMPTACRTASSRATIFAVLLDRPRRRSAADRCRARLALHGRHRQGDQGPRRCAEPARLYSYRRELGDAGRNRHGQSEHPAERFLRWPHRARSSRRRQTANSPSLRSLLPASAIPRSKY